MPTIKKVPRKKGPDRWMFQIDVGVDPETGDRMRKRYYFDDKDEAKAELARIILEKHRGTFVVPSSIKVKEWRALWLESNRDNWKRSTWQFYSDRTLHLEALHGEKKLQELETGHLEELKRGMLSGELRRVGKPGQPLAVTTVNATLDAIDAMLEDAVKYSPPVLWRNVAKSVKRVRDDGAARKRVKKRRGAWQVEHSVAFLQHVQGHRFEGPWWLSMLGQRRGEVLGHYWDESIDLDTGELYVEINRVVTAGEVYEDTPKSAASERGLPIPKPALEALKRTKAIYAAERLAAGVAYQHAGDGPRTTLDLYAEALALDVKNKAGWIVEQLAAQGEQVTEDAVHSRLIRARKKGMLPSAPYVGTSRHLVADEIGRPIRPERYSDMFEELVAEAGLPAITLHGTRHAAASLFAHLGVHIVVAAAWLGQSQQSITEAYQHAYRDDLVQAGDLIGEALSGLGVKRRVK